MGQYDFSCNVSATLVGSDGYSDTLRVYCYWKCNGWRYNISPVYGWVSCNGQEVCVANGIAINFQDNQGQYELGHADFKLNRGQSAYTVGYSARLQSNSSYTSGSRSSGTGSHTVGALASHTVSYNANGGSGAPGNQTKWYGSILYLSNQRPTRTGYTFQGWATSSNGGVAYKPGQAYGADANITLYAVWKPNTWIVKFDANGGSGQPADEIKTYGQTLTLPTIKPSRMDYNFKGWATSKANADKGIVSYKAGGSFTTNADTTLYAVWELAYVRPRINNLSIVRCNSAGTNSESGTYLKVNFSWVTDLTGVYIYAQYKKQTDTNWQQTTLLSNGSSKSGSITNKVIGGNAITAESSWIARIYMYDSKHETGDNYYTYSTEISIGTTKYPIDIRKAGKGIAFGKVAETDNLADFNFDVQMRKTFKLKTPSGIKSFLDAVYPVGSIYMSVKSTNPGTLFGGTWVAWGKGRVPVGINTGDSDFNTVEKTGGEKISSELKCGMQNYGLQKGSSYYGDRTLVRDRNPIDSWDERSAQISLMQPYIVCYMWKRTA